MSEIEHYIQQIQDEIFKLESEKKQLQDLIHQEEMSFDYKKEQIHQLAKNTLENYIPQGLELSTIPINIPMVNLSDQSIEQVLNKKLL